MASTTSRPTTFLLFLTACHLSLACLAQQDSVPVNRKKLAFIATGSAAAYGGSMVVLSKAWYANQARRSFGFFDDAAEWKQLDKVGHIYSAFHLAFHGSHILKSAHLSPRTSDRAAAITGFLMLSSIEVLDGYSAGYGFSWSDVAANAAGSMLYWGQGMLWRDPRIVPKFSFNRTSLAPLRPEVLGNGMEEILKDYNGQTYWLSIDLDKFMRFPKWLNLAVGYGAEDMIYATDSQNHSSGYFPYRQYYISIDPDLTAIQTRSKVLRCLIRVVGLVKLPAPAIEFHKSGVRFHPF